MRYIYLSPHLDDAVLSCGGIIFSQRKAGIPVEIWNWMTKIPDGDLPLSGLARSVHAGWNFASAKEAFTTRLVEDRHAVAIVDAQTRNFDFLDCIYRQADDGSFLYPEEIFVPLRDEDDHLVEEIAALISANLHADDILVSPLGIGNHPDHALVRGAAEQTGHPLCYYADIPYAIWHPDQYAELTAGFSFSVMPVSVDELAGWQDGIAAYSSQMASLFSAEENMRASIVQYWEPIQGIRIFSQP